MTIDTDLAILRDCLTNPTLIYSRKADDALDRVKAELARLRQELKDRDAIRLENRISDLEAALRRVHDDIGLTVYEGTPISVRSGKMLMAVIHDALAGKQP